MSDALRVGINGFGRMGRLALRAGWDRDGLEFVHVNEPQGGPATGAHLLEFDSVHRRWHADIRADDDHLTIDGRSIGWTEGSEPSEIDWAAHGVDLVLECSGRFRTGPSLAPHLERGARKVVVAAPVKDGSALNVVVGVNDDRYDPRTHDIVTAASCTTNCLAPVVKVLHEGIGISHGSITTLHDLTNTQTIVDAPHKDLRRARAAGLSLIPTTTGAATAIGLIFPELQGRLDGIAVRVPLLNASLDTAFLIDTQYRFLALNETFVGPCSLQSARYVLEFGGETEFQSSNGMIFPTGTGMTGWAKSILTSTHERLTLDPATAAVAFLVRKPWPSRHSGAKLRSGLVQDGDSVQLSSSINDGGLVFADGIERGFLHFDWGTELRLGVAPERLNLVV